MNSKGMDVSNLLFPLDKLDDSNESVVIVEGIFDAIRANQEGIKGVATLGGEIKKRQLRLLGEFTNNIVLCPDRDKEGVRLAEKNVNLLEKYGFTVSIAKPSGVAKDLAESIKVDLQIIPKYLLNFNQKSIGNFIGVV
jgi:DNA primase